MIEGVKNVKDYQEFEDLKNEFQYAKEMDKKIYSISNVICGFRGIRGTLNRFLGDGNCFYRAFIYRYIELLLCNGPSYIIDFVKLY